MSMKLKSAIVLLVVLLIAATYMVFSKKDGNLVVGSLLPLTGDVASYGIAIKNGIQLAVDEINNDGGINGIQLQVLYEDDKADPTTGITCAQKLISVNKVQAIVGSVASSVTLAVAPLAEKSKVVMLSPASSSPKITTSGNYIFRNYPSDELEGQLVADFAFDHGFYKTAVLTINNDYGNGLNAVFSSKFISRGGSVILNERYNEGTTDFRTVLTKLAQLSPNSIFIVGYGQELGTIIRQSRELGISAQFLSTVNFQDPQTLSSGRASVRGTIYSSPVFDPKSEQLSIRKFVSDFKLRFGKEPDVWSAHGYDALKILAEVMRKYGTSSEAIRDGLYKTRDHPGVSGKTTFDSNGDVIKEAKFMTVSDDLEFIAYRQ